MRVPQSPRCWGCIWGPKMAFHFHPSPKNRNLQHCWLHQLIGQRGKKNHMTSMAITMWLMFPSYYQLTITLQLRHTHTYTQSHLVSRRSRIWALLLVWRRKRRWAWWGRGHGWQSRGPRCTLSARTESQWGRTAYSRSRPAVFDRQRSAEKTDNCWAATGTHITNEYMMTTALSKSFQNQAQLRQEEICHIWNWDSKQWQK